jgi:hypothetical protein
MNQRRWHEGAERTRHRALERERMREGESERRDEPDSGIHAAGGHRPAQLLAGRRVAQDDEREHDVDDRRPQREQAHRQREVAAEIHLEERGRRPRGDRAEAQRSQRPRQTDPRALTCHC